jgi:hypothetical protein
MFDIENVFLPSRESVGDEEMLALFYNLEDIPC